MKRIYFIIIAFLLTNPVLNATGFSFALITDMHIDCANEDNSTVLASVIEEINANNDIAFVLIAGDVTDKGDSAAFLKTSQLLKVLKKPFYITFGNHDVLSSKAGKRAYASFFDDDKFAFIYNDVFFCGITSCPPQPGANAVITAQDLSWLQNQLNKQSKGIPVFVVTHYPLQTGDVDNWYSLTDLIRQYNVQLVLNGHYHRNALLNYDEIPGIVNRTTQRKSGDNGAYTIYSIDSSIRISEKRVGQTAEMWIELPFENKTYAEPDTSLRQLNYNNNEPITL